jgi:hypothetical protein
MRSPLVLNLSQTNPVTTHKSYLSQNQQALYTHLRLGLPGGLFPPNNLYAFLFTFIRATYPTHFILFDLINLFLVTSITIFQSHLNFFLNQMLICYCCSNIFELRHVFRRSVCYFCVLILTSGDETATYD